MLAEQLRIFILLFPSQHLNNSLSFDTAAANVTLNKIINHSNNSQHCLLICITVTFPVWGYEKSPI